MPSSSYSFLDVVILDEVRERFAAGDALLILSSELDEVIWANGPGAALLGYAGIEAALGAPGGLSAAARRQISALRGFPEIGRDRTVMVRLAAGVTSRSHALLASALSLPDGERAILLALPAQAGGKDTAERAIGGFDEPGHFVALLDEHGRIEAASPGFETLRIAAESLGGLVARIGGDRIAKEMLKSAGGPVPAGAARLTDDPARHLLVAVDEGRAHGESHTEEVTQEEALSPAAASDAEPTPAELRIEGATSEETTAAPQLSGAAEAVPERPEAATPKPAETTQGGHDTWYFSSDDFGPNPVIETQAPAPVESDEPAVSTEVEITDDATNAITADSVEPKTDAESGAAAQPTADPRHVDAPPAQADPATIVDNHSAPVRFVWRTDAQGRFSQISPEFVQAVGGDAADIVGRPFAEVAAALGVDAAGEIAGLLARRDTWSGRSVLWPVSGARLRIPVDLAALPVYGRDRNFEGFRGFGVARLGDAVIDRAEDAPRSPAAAAPASDDAERQQEQPAAEPAPPADPFRGETPALNIVPMPDRRSTDKIIRLAEHRPPADKGALSSGERLAFQQIAERLKRDSAAAQARQAKRTADEQADAAQDAAPGRPENSEDRSETSGSARQTPVADIDDGASEAGDPAEPVSEPGDIADLAAIDGTNPEEPPVAESEPTGSIGAADAPDASGRPAPKERRRRMPRTGMSLLDFAQWNRDDGAEAVQSEKAGAPGIDSDAAAEQPASEAADHTDEAAPEPEALDARDQAGLRIVPAQGEPSGKERAEIAILEKLPVPVLVHSGDTLHYANGEFLDLTGYASIEQLSAAGGIGALFAETYEDEDAPDRRDRQLRLITGRGEAFPVDAFLQSAPWNGGKALLLVLRRAEEAGFGAAGQSPLIAELEARVAEMRTIIDTATDGVVLMDRDGAIRSISRPAEALFSFDSDEVAGKAFESLFAIESQRAVRDYLNGLSDNGVASVLNDGREVIGRESQGRFIPMFMTIGKLPNDSGYCAVVRDITQWKRAEEDLTQARALAERASSQKTEFLARVSHEIRTPLNAIIGFSELMIDEKFGPVTNDRYRDYLRDINRSGSHVLDLVNDLLDITKIEAGQQEMEYEAVSLNDALAETVAMMQPQANRERVIIRSSFASSLPDVVADLRSVRQIALNILSNAVRYTQAGGQVIVSTAYEPTGDVAIRVRDTGIGMTHAEIEQALKPFKQINSLKRARGDGTGLGLPLTKAMVEANRARFAIHSTPGEGTLVEISFPSTRVLAD